MTPKVDPRQANRDREYRIAALVERQHGVVAQSQLRALGLSSRGVTARAAMGRLHRIHHGVYALGRPDLPIEGRWFAAVLACGEGALLSHRSATSLHDLLASPQTAIDITIPRRGPLSRPGLRIHRSTCLTEMDRTTVRGIPCTSVALTLLDLAAVVPRGVLERACDQAEVLGKLDMAAIEELLGRSRGRRGVRVLRAVLGAGDVGEDIPRSELERRFLAICRRARLPSPSVNVWLTAAGEAMKVDFMWRTHGVVVEVDGYRTHGTRQAFRRDRRRDQFLRLAGLDGTRFTWDDVTDDVEHVARVLRDLLSRAERARNASRSRRRSNFGTDGA